MAVEIPDIALFIESFAEHEFCTGEIALVEY